MNSTAVNLGNDMTTFIINKRTDTQQTVVNLFFTINRLQNGQLLELNEGKGAVNLQQTKIREFHSKLTEPLSMTGLQCHEIKNKNNNHTMN